MAKHAHDERQVLCDLLSEVGPDARTLCAGWRTRHLAAHLVLRERRPDVGPGLVLGGSFARHTARVTERLAGRSEWDRLVGRLSCQLRAGPVVWRSIPHLAAECSDFMPSANLPKVVPLTGAKAFPHAVRRCLLQLL